jgi:hypothetical protein
LLVVPATARAAAARTAATTTPMPIAGRLNPAIRLPFVEWISTIGAEARCGRRRDGLTEGDQLVNVETLSPVVAGDSP